MPKPRRESAAEADIRPAFARPPRASVNSPAATPSPAARKISSKPKAKQSPATSPQKKTKRRDHDGSGSPAKKRAEYASSSSAGNSSNILSVDSLAKLDALNEKQTATAKAKDKKSRQKHYGDVGQKGAAGQHERRRKKHKNRDTSGALLEEGRMNEKRAHVRSRGGGGNIVRGRGGDSAGDSRSRRKRLWILAGVTILLLLIIIPVAIVVSNKHHGSGGGSSTSSGNNPTNGELDGVDPSSIPTAAKGTYLDPFSWYDTSDFNVTYTNDTVGGLPVMGLKMTWSDTARPNDNVPPLNENFTYGQMPIRGVNIGGWLSVEPFITPSLFNSYSASDNVIDEYTLTQKLGPSMANTVLENHYATFVTKQTFIDIANAGMDHVRIPYSYWAVVTYPGDPYVFRTSWRYLLRGIEYAREQGLRVNLDLHALPGSQNGWNHSGRQGVIGWLNGTDGSLNAQRALDIHNQLSQFFAQPRYKNVVTIYGLANEPRMINLPLQPILDWTTSAVQTVRKNGLEQLITFSDGFLELTKWHGLIENIDNRMVMDTHQYVIFNAGQIAMTHQNKINMACGGWSGIITNAVNPSTGWGPTLCGEFSQADTDCATYLNNVNVGSRWTGTLNTQDPSTQVLSPTCPSASKGPPCDCTPANANPSQYSASYKQFLQMFAEAQMNSFEKGWGWFYWTWETESATQWSWKLGMQAGILPQKAYAPSFNCSSDVPDFSDLPENY